MIFSENSHVKFILLSTLFIFIFTLSSCGDSLNGISQPKFHEFTCKKADLNSDGLIGTTDLVLLKNCYNSKLGDDKYDNKYDLNSDDIINVYDLDLLKCCYGYPEKTVFEESCYAENKK
jgi:hypothetical protein